MGNAEDGQKYAARAGNFANVWNPDTTVPDDDTGIVGFMQVRLHIADVINEY
jgi:putative alpha-1,2-mannosidase